MLLGSHHTSPVRCQIGIERMMARREGRGPPPMHTKVDLGSFVQMQSRSISYYYLADSRQAGKPETSPVVKKSSPFPFFLSSLYIRASRSRSFACS